MNVLLAPHGTRGDVQPMLALATALRARGHVAAFVAPSNFGDWIRAHGFHADSDGIDVAAMLRSASVDFDSTRWQMRYIADVLMPALFESVPRGMPDAHVIVGSGVQFAAASVAEQRGVAYASAIFCPCAVPSSATPPPTVRAQNLPRWLNRLLWTVGGPMADLALRRSFNAGRTKLGLPPIGGAFGHLMEQCVLMAADRDLGPLGDDAIDTAVSTDAWILDEPPAALDRRVEAFLDQDPAPVYVGFGSMVAKQAATLTADAIAAVRAVGRCVLLGSGWAGLERHAVAADDVLAVDTLPHASVFPRVGAVVHHGGAGTTTAAARAGVPQVLLPHILDQFYWAFRIEMLGLGPRGLPVDLVTADVLSDRIDAALRDEEIRARAATLGRSVAARNGVESAVDHLERLALHSMA
ncbi:MAG TPA: glycosyltransferase [Vicinamibacterales bacterium]|nr:glycosyltransferase [Vicinamibacterales bacterium]